MHYAGILVVVESQAFDESVRLLNAQPGVSVHHTQPSAGRIIVVQETETLSEQEESLRRLQKLPHVVLAELVNYQVDDADDEGTSMDPDAQGDLA